MISFPIPGFELLARIRGKKRSHHHRDTEKEKEYEKRMRKGERGRKRNPTDTGIQTLHTAHGPLSAMVKIKCFFPVCCCSDRRFPAWLMQLRNVPC